MGNRFVARNPRLALEGTAGADVKCHLVLHVIFPIDPETVVVRCVRR